MQSPISLKTAENQVFKLSCSDGLWDIMLGCIVLELAIAPLLSKFMGDFWSSAIFLPFWGLIYFVLKQVRKKVILPRIGKVTYGKVRQKKLRIFSWIMIGINLILLIIGIIALLSWKRNPAERITFQSGVNTFLFGFLLLVGFSLASYLFGFKRMFIYGLLLFLAPQIGEWLSVNHGFLHHGYPIVFGITSATMIIIGLIQFVFIMKKFQLVKMDPI